MQTISSELNYSSNLLHSSFKDLVLNLPGISLDNQLLLVGVRIHLGHDEQEDVQTLLDKSTLIDWKCLMTKARYNGLSPLLYQVLRRCDHNQIPEKALATLRRQVHSMVHLNQFLLKELATSFQGLSATEIRLLAFKGPTLALAAYGDLSLRQPGDLDFLVAPESFDRASQFFQTRGYVIRAEYTWATWLRRESTKLEIDLHRTVAGAYLPFQLDFDEIWARRQQTTIAGITFNHPCTEDLLVLLCVQFAKDTHDNQRRLIKICDIAAVIKHSSLDWSLVLAIAHQSKGDRPLKLGLSIVETLFSIELPSAIRTYAHSDWLVGQYRLCICKEFFIARSGDRSVLGLVWRALFLFQDPLFEWKYNLRLMKLFMHSVVNKARKGWPSTWAKPLAISEDKQVEHSVASAKQTHNP